MQPQAIYIGIDPGVKGGAFSFLNQFGETICLPLSAGEDKQGNQLCYTPSCLKIPQSTKVLANIATELRKFVNVRFVLEDPHAFPGFAIHTYKPLFEQLGVLKALFPEAILVAPKTWQAAVWTDEAKAMPKGTNAKERSLLSAKRYWKHCTFREENEPGKPHDGIVDAYLIAMYGVMTQGGNRQ